MLRTERGTSLSQSQSSWGIPPSREPAHKPGLTAEDLWSPSAAPTIKHIPEVWAQRGLSPGLSLEAVPPLWQTDDPSASQGLQHPRCCRKPVHQHANCGGNWIQGLLLVLFAHFFLSMIFGFIIFRCFFYLPMHQEEGGGKKGRCLFKPSIKCIRCLKLRIMGSPHPPTHPGKLAYRRRKKNPFK